MSGPAGRDPRAGRRERHALLLLSSETYRAEDFLDAAAELDVSVTVASDHRNALAHEVPGATLHIDFERPDEAVRAIVDLAARKSIDAVIAAEDAGTRVAAAAGAALGLASNPVEAVQSCRRKDRFRALEIPDVPTPWHRVVRAEDDPSRIAPDIEYPCVVKPVALAAGRGVVRADAPADFLAAVAEARLATHEAGRDEPVLAEGYIPGAEVALEGILVDGQLRPLALLDKPVPLTGPYFEETMFTTPSRLAPDRQAEVERTVEAVVRAAGLRNGPIHAELRINDGGVWPIEVAPRTIGGMCARMFRHRAGISLEEVVLRAALGEEPRDLPAAGSTGAFMIPIPHGGVFRGVEGTSDALAVPGIEEVTITARRGQRIEPLPRGHRYLGFIFACAETPADVERALAEAHRRLDVRIDPDAPGAGGRVSPSASGRGAEASRRST
ncbi:MAG: ATP-grasp domain-containing protein [Gemmatimonadota bacterium]|nr:ATP-grasp domain-containing protein [Gemmatimonadota bacterium]